MVNMLNDYEDDGYGCIQTRRDFIYIIILGKAVSALEGINVIVEGDL